MDTCAGFPDENQRSRGVRLIIAASFIATTSRVTICHYQFTSVPDQLPVAPPPSRDADSALVADLNQLRQNTCGFEAFLSISALSIYQEIHCGRIWRRRFSPDDVHIPALPVRRYLKNLSA